MSKKNAFGKIPHPSSASSSSSSSSSQMAPMANLVRVSSRNLKLIESNEGMRYRISQMGRYFKQWFVCHHINLEVCQGPRLMTRLKRLLYLYSSDTGRREEEKKARKKKKQQNTCSFWILERSFSIVLEMGHGRICAESSIQVQVGFWQCSCLLLHPHLAGSTPTTTPIPASLIFLRAFLFMFFLL